MAQEIKNPLHAISLLMDNSFKMGASMILTNLKTIDQDRRYYKQDLTLFTLFDDAKNSRMKRSKKLC